MIGHEVSVKVSKNLGRMDYKRADYIINETSIDSFVIDVYEFVKTNDLGEELVKMNCNYKTLSPNEVWVYQDLGTSPYWYKEVEPDKDTCSSYIEAKVKALQELRYLCMKHNIGNIELVEEALKAVESEREETI